MSDNKDNTAAEEGGMRVITKEHKMAYETILGNKARLKLDQEAIAEDIKGLAAKIGLKPKKLNEIMTIALQEKEKGGVIQDKEDTLEMAKKLIDDAE